MKKILVLQGSPRAQSVSAALCDSLLEAAREGFEIKRYNAYELNAKPCLACGYCDKTQGCCLNDLDEFMADFEAADYFVVSTPVFNGGVPSPLKAVVDRFQRYYALRFAHGKRPPIEKPKKAALIIAAGSKGEGKEAIENMFRCQFTVLNTALETVAFVDSTDTNLPCSEEFENARKIGEKLFE